MSFKFLSDLQNVCWVTTNWTFLDFWHLWLHERKLCPCRSLIGTIYTLYHRHWKNPYLQAHLRTPWLQTWSDSIMRCFPHPSWISVPCECQEFLTSITGIFLYIIFCSPLHQIDQKIYSLPRSNSLAWNETFFHWYDITITEYHRYIFLAFLVFSTIAINIMKPTKIWNLFMKERWEAYQC